MRKRAQLGLAAALLYSLGLAGSASPTPPTGYISTYVWQADDPRFGGFSAIEMDGTGTSFVAISDHGAFVKGRVSRDSKLQIIGVTNGVVTLLRGEGPNPLKSDRNDSEGLAVGKDGVSYVSFEGVARVLRYRTIDGPAENLPVHPDFRKMQINSALEALAIGPDGTLYTLPERSGDMRRPFPVYRFRNGKWDKTLTISRTAAFLPVSADIGPDGRFYLLEREFEGFFGFASRLRRFDISDTALSNEKLIFESPVGAHDNLEGMSIWRDSFGILRATMVSDDNFNVFQRTEIVEYRLPD